MPALLTVDVLTLFPGMLGGFLAESILGRAAESGLLAVRTHNLRDWTEDKWQIADDRPFGGGAGMVLKPEPLWAALDELEAPGSTIVYLSPDGEPLTSALARELSTRHHLVLISGHYEGVDQRVRDARVHREVSIGDYILTNGTLAAAVLIDAVARYVPGVLGEPQSLQQDSFNNNLLGAPQYTRPVEFAGLRVPDILLSGNHKEIERWRQEQRLRKTRQRRPELLEHLTAETHP